MSTLEIVGGIVLLIVSALVIILCLSQEQKSQDSMSAALTGASTDSFYGKNEGRSKAVKSIAPLNADLAKELSPAE